MTARPVADGLFVWPGPPQLIAGRCVPCDAVTFPRQASCPRCTRSDVIDELLPTRGVLWSWTIQSFRPKSLYRGPDVFEPYGVGYVALADLCIVEARLTSANPEELHIGGEMELTLLPFATDEDGTDVLTYAFQPVGATA